MLLLAAAEPSVAGTICGTVRNTQTAEPIPAAAVFLYDDLNQYTGLSATTGQDGFYCILDIPVGTYAIKVQVDDYVAAVVINVVVDDATAVDIDAMPRFYLGQPAPNPASSEVVFRVAAPTDESVALEVFDARGRLVKGWRGEGSGVRTIYWDLRDTRGAAVASGVYFVRLHAGGAQQVRRLVCVR